jgi:abequosyltransferase
MLSIVIPTFNRAPHLSITLPAHLSLAKKYQIKLYVYDNGSTDETEAVVRELQIKHSNLIYKKNPSGTVGANFEKVLSEAISEYVWLIGDTYTIPPETFEYIFNRLKIDDDKYDLYLLNMNSEVTHVPSKDYSDCNELLTDLWWVITNCSCTVYKNTLLRSANYERYVHTNYLHAGIVFEYFATRKFLVHWKSNYSIAKWRDTKSITKNSWQNETMKIWFEDRLSFIMSLPPIYLISNKINIAKECDRNIKFDFRHFIALRSAGYFDLRSCVKYKYIFPYITNTPYIIAVIVSILPSSILSGLLKMRKNLLKK